MSHTYSNIPLLFISYPCPCHLFPPLFSSFGHKSKPTTGFPHHHHHHHHHHPLGNRQSIFHSKLIPYPNQACNSSRASNTSSSSSSSSSSSQSQSQSKFQPPSQSQSQSQPLFPSSTPPTSSPPIYLTDPLDKSKTPLPCTILSWKYNKNNTNKDEKEDAIMVAHDHFRYYMCVPVHQPVLVASMKDPFTSGPTRDNNYNGESGKSGNNVRENNDKQMWTDAKDNSSRSASHSANASAQATAGASWGQLTILDDQHLFQKIQLFVNKDTDEIETTTNSTATTTLFQVATNALLKENPHYVLRNTAFVLTVEGMHDNPPRKIKDNKSPYSNIHHTHDTHYAAEKVQDVRSGSGSGSLDERIWTRITDSNIHPPDQRENQDITRQDLQEYFDQINDDDSLVNFQDDAVEILADFVYTGIQYYVCRPLDQLYFITRTNNAASGEHIVPPDDELERIMPQLAPRLEGY